MSMPTLVELLDYDKPGKDAEDEKRSLHIRIFKTKELPMPEKQATALIVDFVKFAVAHLKITNEEVHIRLVHAAPKEEMTTGAFDPNTKRVSVIIQNRHFIDYCRTIAHELTHMKQESEGRVEKKNQEIGGPIEDEANSLSGQVVKLYIKDHLTKEQKKYLGLGVY